MNLLLRTRFSIPLFPPSRSPGAEWLDVLLRSDVKFLSVGAVFSLWFLRVSTAPCSSQHLDVAF